MTSTIPETRPETHPETVTRLQREAGRSAKPDSSLHGLAGDQVQLPVPVQRATWGTISSFQRYDVLRKIAALAALEERGFNQARGCCFFEICPRDRQGIAEAIDRLMRYAIKGGAS